jgi:endonuclease/exonuclease/phosphatase family metal-dependent hydrolase
MRIPRNTFRNLTYAYFSLLILIFIFNQLGPESHVLTFANLYLPQGYWAIPIAPLLIGSLFRENPKLAPVMRCSLVLIFLVLALMDFRFTGRLFGSNANTTVTPIRFMTYNIAGGKNTDALMKIIINESPSVILFQESSPDFLRDFRDSFPAWNIASSDDLAIASIYEISNFIRADLPKLSNDEWKRPAYVRAVVSSGISRFAVYNTHLSTPREALNAMRHLQSNFHDLINRNIRDRENQSKRLATAVSEEKLPFILGGDFNAPEKSIMLSPFTNLGLKNVFSERGLGFGYTKGHDLQLGFSFIRIDHIFISRDWLPVSSHVGSSLGSDHRPVLADVLLAK